MSDTVEVIVGIVGRAHGIKGEVGIDVRTDEPERRFTPGAVLGREGGGELTVESVRDHSGRMLVRFRGHADRTAVETLRGTVLVVQVDATARPADEEEYYDRQLTGLGVLDAAGVEVGRIADVIHLPEQDLLEIRTDGGTRLIPFVRALVPEVDLAAGTVRLAEVPGLLTDLDETAAEQSEQDGSDPDGVEPDGVEPDGSDPEENDPAGPGAGSTGGAAG